MTGLQVKHY